MKTVIVYRWNSNSEEALIRVMKKMGFDVFEVDKKIKDYHADADFAQEMITCIHKVQADAVFSYDYFPIISSVCKINKIPYLSWIYDCPLYSLNSLTIKNKCNYIFCFDAVYTEKIQNRGALNCFHLPLGIDCDGFDRMIRDSSEDLKGKYTCDVSFVGSLYNDERNRLRTAQMDEYLKGYLEGVIEAQRQVYGYNFVEELLQEKGVAEKVTEVCRMQLGNMYTFSWEEMAADAVNMEVTAREREGALRTLADGVCVELYTGSELPDDLQQFPNVKNRGYADNKTEMPLIFSESKINLNISSRSIVSGIPLRVLDILACGGFCLTNYQPEIAEFLADGEEVVMYTGMPDLQEKIRYYLEHEEERKQIAINGQKAVRERFLLEDRIRDMFEIIGE